MAIGSRGLQKLHEQRTRARVEAVHVVDDDETFGVTLDCFTALKELSEWVSLGCCEVGKSDQIGLGGIVHGSVGLNYRPSFGGKVLACIVEEGRKSIARGAPKHQAIGVRAAFNLVSVSRPHRTIVSDFMA